MPASPGTPPTREKEPSMRAAVVASVLASFASFAAGSTFTTPARAETAAGAEDGGALVYESGQARLFAGTPARLDARSRARARLDPQLS